MDDLGFSVVGPVDAPAIVLGPSLGSTKDIWDAQAVALSERFRVVSYDLLGHGTSAEPPGPYTMDRLGRAVLDLYDDLGLATAHYAGVSLGGMIGMWLAVNAPERVDKLILVCTTAYLPPAEGWTDRAAQVRAHGTASIADAIVSRWFTEPFQARSPQVVAGFRQMIANSPDEGYAACCEAIAGMDQRGSIATITAPTLVLAGADDPSIPPVHGEAIAATVPNARCVVLDNAAHLANVEQAPGVTTLISEFLEGR